MRFDKIPAGSRPTDIVVTTIWEPTWLQGYLDNLRANGRDQDVTLRIICDRKTPASVYASAEQARAQGFRIDCPTLAEQSAYLDTLGLPEDFIPWNSDNRRNIGFLRAWDNGAEVLISIDDDNYCQGASDFVGHHHAVGQTAGALDKTQLAEGAPWFNLCTRLEGAGHIYPRGYPYAARDSAHQAGLHEIPPGMAQRTISINAGLWLEEPDVDAVTRLALRPRISAARPGGVILGDSTWSPINTQNTAVLRAAIPAYYYLRMGFPLQGMKVDRFGDILSGYFVQKCAKHLGHVVRIGAPVTRHVRTPHNLFVDLYHELAGIVLVEELSPWLQELKLSGGDYVEAYGSLADALASEADRFKGFIWDQGGREFLRESAQCMGRWLEVLKRMA